MSILDKLSIIKFCNEGIIMSQLGKYIFEDIKN